MGAEALIGGLASLGGSALTQALGMSNAKLSYRQTRDLMALQNQYTRENWQMENNYNSPKAQMARLKAAGLNPNLVYGSGAAGVSGLSGSMDSPSSPSSPVAPTPDFSSVVGDAVNAAVGMANAEKANSDTMKTNIENKYLADQLMANLVNTKALTSLNEEKCAEVSMQCQNLSATWNLMQQQIVNAKKEGELSQKQIDTFDRRFNAELDYLSSQSDFTKEQKEILSENRENIIKLAKGQADLATTAAALAKKYGDAQAVIGMLTSVVSAGADLLGVVTKQGAKLLGKTVENFAGGKHETYHYGN